MKIYDMIQISTIQQEGLAMLHSVASMFILVGLSTISGHVAKSLVGNDIVTIEVFMVGLFVFFGIFRALFFLQEIASTVPIKK